MTESSTPTERITDLQRENGELKAELEALKTANSELRGQLDRVRRVLLDRVQNVIVEAGEIKEALMNPHSPAMMAPVLRAIRDRGPDIIALYCWHAGDLGLESLEKFLKADPEPNLIRDFVRNNRPRLVEMGSAIETILKDFIAYDT